MRPPLAPGRGSLCVTFFSKLSLARQSGRWGSARGGRAGEFSKALQKNRVRGS